MPCVIMSTELDTCWRNLPIASLPISQYMGSASNVFAAHPGAKSQPIITMSRPDSKESQPPTARKSENASILIDPPDSDPFARIPHRVLNDDSLTWQAKGVLCYLLQASGLESMGPRYSEAFAQWARLGSQCSPEAERMRVCQQGFAPE